MNWTIYELLSETGDRIYVGLTNNERRRMKEHRRERGPIAYEVLETCSTLEDARLAEVKWIQDSLRSGMQLQNRITWLADGTFGASEETREKLSRVSRGKPKPPGFGAKLSAITKGRPHQLSPEVRANMARTQFKPGAGRFADKPAEEQQRLREIRRRNWDSIPAEERSRRAIERNRAAWSKRSPEERAAIGRRISEAKKRGAQ